MEGVGREDMRINEGIGIYLGWGGGGGEGRGEQTQTPEVLNSMFVWREVDGGRGRGEKRREKKMVGI